jgi:hypothetical protein
MRRLVCSLVLAVSALLLVPLPASAAEPEYETLVGCDDLSEAPVPSHECQLGDIPGAFFEANVDTELEVCVEFPNAKELCTEEEPVEAETLFVVSIFSELEGDHLVTWYVEGVKIDSWAFRLNAPPPPPPAVTPAPPAASAPVVVVTRPSAECLQAQKRVNQLRTRLRKAEGRKQKAKLRAKLRSARAAERRLC